MFQPTEPASLLGGLLEAPISEQFLLTEADDLLGALSSLEENNHAILDERLAVAPSIEEAVNANDLLFFPKKEEGVLLDGKGEEPMQNDILQQVITEIEMTPETLSVPVDSGLSANTSCSSLSSTWSEQQPMDTLELEPGMLDLISDVDHTALSAASPAASSSADDTQHLIEEVEEFLVEHESIQRRASSISLSSNDDDSTDQGIVMTNRASSNGSVNAERLLEALVKGNVSLNEGGPSLSNVSEIVTADGQRIVIVVAKDDEVEQVKQALSPSASAASLTSVASPAPSDTSDSDWSPSSPPAVKKTTTAAKNNKTSVARSKKKAKDLPAGGYSGIKDKKERKKLQNVVAARRYRDKKKSELACVEEEESELLERNNTLKAKLSDVESEVNTLKKLMAELGLIKVANAARKANKN